MSPDPRFLFMSNRYREALAHLNYGIEDGGGFVLLTGEVGTGKTTVCRCLLQQLPKKTRLAFVLNPKLNSVELLATICDELGVSYPPDCDSLKMLTDRLSHYLLTCYEQGLNVVVMIDEAQNLAVDVLEQIRLLTNLETNQKKLLQIILVGQPELQEKLAQRNLRQLAQRITARYHLRPLNLKETMAYILHRIRIAGSRKNMFTREGVELLHAKTTGIPRLINTICDRALVAACSRNRMKIDQAIMLDAVYDVMGRNGKTHTEQPKKKIKFKMEKWMIWAGIGCFMGLSFWLGQLMNQPKSDSGRNQITSSDSLTDELKKKEVSEQGSRNLLDKMLGNEEWDNTGNWSMEKLLSLWQVNYSALMDGNSCDYAATYGLVCRSNSGTWQQLREYDRPAIMRFSAGIQGKFWGTLKKMSGLNATLILGDKEIVARLDELSTVWTGEYQLVWQAPNGFDGDLKLGDKGPAVSWLAKKMKLLVDTQVVETSIFTQSLEDSLKLYQEQRNIKADGVAGMKTILSINGETLVGIPRLR